MMKGQRAITHSHLGAIYSYPCECNGNLGSWGSGHPTQDHRCLMIGSKRKKETTYQVEGELSVPLQQANENWVFPCYTSDRINLSRHLINI